MRIKITILFSILAVALNIGALKAQKEAELRLAETYFKELDSLCNLDNGNMWGVKLYGATMFVFPETRLIIANESDNNGKLVHKNGLYIGKLPDNINIANTSFVWNNKGWTMVNWENIPEKDKYSRGKLLIHESWHRNQEEIGIQPVMTENTHLDESKGGILLKLEFIALRRALNAETNDKINHLNNALTIRSYRQLLFPENNENIFELHEGMAEYTGLKLCGIEKKLLPKIAAKQLEISMNNEGLANSFAYLTGPAYGLLFDELKKNWLNDVKGGKTLTEIGEYIINKKEQTDTTLLRENIVKIISLYEADSLIKEETEKFESQKQLVDKYRQKFFEDDVLIIKNNNLQMSFNPQEKIISVENGVVYTTMRLVGAWGVADVKNGIFRSNDWRLFMLPAPVTGKTETINEIDYRLELNDGWEVVKIKEGTYLLDKK